MSEDTPNNQAEGQTTRTHSAADIRDLAYGNPDGKIHSELGKWDNEKKTHVVRYRFGLVPEYAPTSSGRDFAPVTPEQREAALMAMQEISAVANVTFESVDDQPYHESDADMVFSQAKSEKELSFAGLMALRNKPQSEKDAEKRAHVIIDPRKHKGYSRTEGGYRTMLHELMHALGCSHPGEKYDGKNKGGNVYYSEYDTVLSYNVSPPGEGKVRGLMPLDVAVLQKNYGPAWSIEHNVKIDPADLNNHATIVTSGNIELNPSKPSYVKLSLDCRDMRAVSFDEQGIPSKAYARINYNVMGSIIADENTPILVSGGDAPIKDIEFVKAGNANDLFYLNGQPLVLITGQGKDTIMLHEKSGKESIIADFDPKKDRVTIPDGVPYKITQIDDDLGSRAYLTLLDKDGKELSKAAFSHCKAGDLEQSIEKIKINPGSMIDPVFDRWTADAHNHALQRTREQMNQLSLGSASGDFAQGANMPGWEPPAALHNSAAKKPASKYIPNL
jgi:hypothetical protein